MSNSWYLNRKLPDGWEDIPLEAGDSYLRFPAAGADITSARMNKIPHRIVFIAKDTFEIHRIQSRSG